MFFGKIKFENPIEEIGAKIVRPVAFKLMIAGGNNDFGCSCSKSHAKSVKNCSF